MVTGTRKKTKKEIVRAEAKRRELEEKQARQEEEQARREEIRARRQKKRERPPRPNAIIVEPPMGWYLSHLDEPVAGQYGRQWRYGNLWVYLLLMKKEVIPPKNEGDAPTTIESLTPIGIPQKLGQLPDKLYRALFWKEGEILFSLRNTLLEKLNTFSMYILIAILLFFIYLIYSSM